jgi:Lrp/AsnC family leucine-responsive transcriptional regulator
MDHQTNRFQLKSNTAENIIGAMVTKVKFHQTLDAKDRKILALVQRDAMLSQSEIAKRVGLSTAAVNERLKKLLQAGVIRRWSAIVDPAAVGAGVGAFIEVFFEHPRFEASFIKRALELDEVQECHHITGEFSLLLKVRVRDMESLQQLLLHQMSGMEGVRQTRTVMVLSTVKEDGYVSVANTGGDA